MRIILDSTPLGLCVQRSGYRDRDAALAWFGRHIDAGNEFVVPEIVDYELRRELIRAKKNASVKRLDALAFAPGVVFLPLNSRALRLAAEMWAKVRQEGKPTADPHALDVDVILAAQILAAGFDANDCIVATSNIGHLSLFVRADEWSNI